MYGVAISLMMCRLDITGKNDNWREYKTVNIPENMIKICRI